MPGDVSDLDQKWRLKLGVGQIKPWEPGEKPSSQEIKGHPDYRCDPYKRVPSLQMATNSGKTRYK